MNQEKIGQFIQTVRKERGLTQKALGEQINVSDKTISKWENGNSLPDISALSELCAVLEISVNELLAGEKLPPHVYSEKAEENMMSLLKENETNRKSIGKQRLIGGILSLIVLLILLFTSLCGVNKIHITWFMDLPTLLFLILACLVTVLFSGAKGVYAVTGVIQKTLIPASAALCMFSAVIVLAGLEDPATLGPNLCVLLLTPLYALVAYLILIPVRYRASSSGKSE